jgi:tRNA (cytidine/uridine-2'-O-)-methyltransferase
VFGREADGLPEPVLADFPAESRLRIPMRPGNRSLNLANAVSIVAYEAWRQLGFAGSGAAASFEEARPTIETR